ncbi:GHKL domain-containing protein [Lacihabitans sp. LS3-19]|uniref:sensor histidine kinase n=1 Tax=Lacihabitans sp. LS3-19 TaxID=2487335 RepID=UPI0020CF25BA|nr:ATP-binding protein [Lacihabitans sp. LS3-19]MCP9770749.1 GHKL domain-containing protein [Lacihabitans sp. LS3-19]
MVNFLITFFVINFIRKKLKIEVDKYNLETPTRYLVFFILPFALVIDLVLPEKFQPMVNFIWFGLNAYILYVLWIIRENNLSFTLLKAGFPLFLIVSIKGFFDSIAPSITKEYSNIFNFFSLGGLVWLVAYAVSFNNQKKALKAEEEKNKKILNENEVLDNLVKERTAEILAQKEELEATVEELKATQNQLVQQEKLASLGELTAGIAHEIQNPLNFVNNFSELNVELVSELAEALKTKSILTTGSIEEELLQDLSQNMEKINFHGKRASSIVKGMLQHSRTSTGQKEPTDINDLADEFLRLSYHGLRAKDKTFNSDFKTDFDADLPKIEAVPQDIGRVFLNLINNAFYACNERSKTAKENNESYKPLVTVSTKKLGKTIEISIKDNGSGISEENKAKIFQPFFTTKPTGKGTGLGLSLAYDIVTKGHGGTLAVESEVGVGTTFKINLPL